MASSTPQALVIATARGTKNTFSVRVVTEADDQEQGLSGEHELGAREGMLFPLPWPSAIRMWMKDALIPLDILFVRADGVIHRIEAMAELRSERMIWSNGLVLAALELRGGTCAELGVQPGDRVEYAVFAQA